MIERDTILIIDDHQVVRIGIEEIVREIIPFSTILHASNSIEIKKELQNPNLKMVISDLRIPGIEIIQLLKDILEKNTTIYVLIFSVCSEFTHAKYCYSVGCKGYIEKKAPRTEIKLAIESVYLGKRYVSENMIEELFNPAKKNFSKSINSLSRKEQYIANCLMDGDSMKVICNKLNLKPSTVSTFKKRIFDKLEISSIVELINLYNNLVK